MLDGTAGGGGGAESRRGDDAGGGYLARTAFNVAAAIAEGWDDGEDGVGEGGRQGGSGRHVAVVKVAMSRRSLQPMGQSGPRVSETWWWGSTAIRRSLQGRAAEQAMARYAGGKRAHHVLFRRRASS